jgi:hypothetical protein
MSESRKDGCEKQGRADSLGMAGLCARQYRADARGNAGRMREPIQGMCARQGRADARGKSQWTHEPRPVDAEVKSGRMRE